MSDIAPILFVCPGYGSLPSRLMLPPKLMTVSDVVEREFSWEHGVTVIITNADEAAVRVGPPELGFMGYTTTANALAFAAAVLTEINRQLRVSDEKCNRRPSVTGWPS